MSVELLGVVLLGLGYLALLFACGMAVERGWVPVRITRHPIVYTLALGVYASAWAIYGSVELAAQAGFWLPGILPRCSRGFSAGAHTAVPIQRITRTQLSSLADLFLRSLPIPLGRHSGNVHQPASRDAAAGYPGANLKRCGLLAHRQPL